MPRRETSRGPRSSQGTWRQASHLLDERAAHENSLRIACYVSVVLASRMALDTALKIKALFLVVLKKACLYIGSNWGCENPAN